MVQLSGLIPTTFVRWLVRGRDARCVGRGRGAEVRSDTKYQEKKKKRHLQCKNLVCDERARM